MRFKMVGNKRDVISVVVKSAEASGTSIVVGSPVCLKLDGTNDGLAVYRPSNAAANAHAGFFGVALNAIDGGRHGECAVFGFIPDAVLFRASRAASGDSWTSSDSIANLVLLNVDTVNNAFSTSGGTQAKSAFLPFAILAESIVSFAASASAATDTRTAMTVAANVFLRAM